MRNEMETDFRARYTLVDKTDPAAIAAAQEAGETPKHLQIPPLTMLRMGNHVIWQLGFVLIIKNFKNTKWTAFVLSFQNFV